jgi:hypothetical protein
VLKFKAVAHPAYKPDLAASNLDLFGTVKGAVEVVMLQMTAK